MSDTTEWRDAADEITKWIDAAETTVAGTPLWIVVSAAREWVARAVDLIESQAAEIERLRAGGCARDQGTTQFCAEAASAFSVVNMLRAEIAELSAGGWREIDDEARNGEWRMLCGKYGEIFRGRWAPSYNGWMDAGGNSVRKPTHYAPLPTAPEAEA